MTKKSFFIGCSGFHYKSWKETFYPEDLPEKDWLSYYSEKFNSVEINNSFYRLPEKSTLREWAGDTPDNFRFTLKGSRYVTHMKKMKMDASLKDSVKKFYDTAFTLKDKLGCVLWQLPGNQHRDDEKLKAFCDLLSRDVPNCIEFRHGSWLEDDVFEILDKSKTGFCIVSSPDESLKSLTATGSLAYFRFHGENGNGKWYDYDYSDQELTGWAKAMNKSKPSMVFAYFNNDIHARAPVNALTLKEKL